MASVPTSCIAPIGDTPYIQAWTPEISLLEVRDHVRDCAACYDWLHDHPTWLRDEVNQIICSVQVTS